MILNLDHTQRLNVIAILDGLECHGRREAYAVCRLQEQLDLNDDERTIIGWRKQKDDKGREYVLWNAQAVIGVKPYEISEDDLSRICKAIDKYPAVLARDKNWYLPLIAQLPDKEQSNGATAAS